MRSKESMWEYTSAGTGALVLAEALDEWVDEFPYEATGIGRSKLLVLLMNSGMKDEAREVYDLSETAGLMGFGVKFRCQDGPMDIFVFVDENDDILIGG